MDQDLRERLKAERLRDYEAQIFILTMDVAALEAVGDSENAEKCKVSIEQLKKSYAAVEAL